jgi:hypothetical protein
MATEETLDQAPGKTEPDTDVERRRFLQHAGRAAACIPAAVLLLNAAATSSFARNLYKGKGKNPPPALP